MNTQRFFHLISYIAAIPVATMIAAFDRYGAGVVIPSFAWPMLFILTVAFLVPTLIIFFRKTFMHEERLWTSIVALPLSFLLAFSIMAGLRLYFSLGFTITFSIITILWTLWIDRYYRGELRSNRFGLAKVGNWQLIYEPTPDVSLLEDPTQLASTDLDGLVIDYHAGLSDGWKSAIAQFALSRRPVYHISQFFEIAHERVAIAHLDDDHNILTIRKAIYPVFKRFIDVVLAISFLIVLFVPLLLILLLVRITSSGPSIYVQERIGINGTPFELYKIRTMIDASEGDQAQFTLENDPRITGIGKALRLLRIDEWPQFWNVLRGDMSLIGPRPERPTWVENFSTEIPYYNLRHAVRPGITGWAQVRQGYAAGLNQSIKKLEYDLYYVKHLGLYIDFRILIKTLSVVLRQFGAK